MRPLLVVLGLLSLLAPAAPSTADDPARSGPDPVGKVVAVEGRVQATLGADTRRVERGEAVYRDDWIETEPKSRAKIRLDDETELVVGPSSRIHLDEFVYDASAGTGQVLVEIGVGLLRFTSGVLEPEGYEVKTPVASIGVRGTLFDTIVEFATTVILREGKISVASLVKSRIVDQADHASEVRGSGEEPSEPRPATKEEEDRTDPLKRPFRDEIQSNRLRPNLPTAVTKPNLPSHSPPMPSQHLPPTQPKGPPSRPGRY